VRTVEPGEPAPATVAEPGPLTHALLTAAPSAERTVTPWSRQAGSTRTKPGWRGFLTVERTRPDPASTLSEGASPALADPCNRPSGSTATLVVCAQAAPAARASAKLNKYFMGSRCTGGRRGLPPAAPG